MGARRHGGCATPRESDLRSTSRGARQVDRRDSNAHLPIDRGLCRLSYGPGLPPGADPSWFGRSLVSGARFPEPGWWTRVPCSTTAISPRSGHGPTVVGSPLAYWRSPAHGRPWPSSGAAGFACRGRTALVLRSDRPGGPGANRTPLPAPCKGGVPPWLKPWASPGVCASRLGSSRFRLHAPGFAYRKLVDGGKLPGSPGSFHGHGPASGGYVPRDGARDGSVGAGTRAAGSESSPWPLGRLGVVAYPAARVRPRQEMGVRRGDLRSRCGRSRRGRVGRTPCPGVAGFGEPLFGGSRTRTHLLGCLSSTVEFSIPRGGLARAA